MQDSKIKPRPIHKKEPWMQTDHTTDKTQKWRTQVFKILNTTNTICEENCQSSSWVQVSLSTKKCKCII